MFKIITKFKNDAFLSVKNVFVDPDKRKNVITYTGITALMSVLFSFFGSPEEKISDFYMSIIIPMLCVCFIAFVIVEALDASIAYLMSSIVLILLGVSLQLRLVGAETDTITFWNFHHLKMLIFTLGIALLITPLLILFVKISDKQCEISLPKGKGEVGKVTFSVKKILLAILISAIIALYVLLVFAGDVKNGAKTSIKIFGNSFQITEIIKVLSVIGFTFAYTLYGADDNRSLKHWRIKSKLIGEYGFIISLVILAINAAFLLIVRELGTLLIIGIMFFVETVIHHPKSGKRLIPFLIVAVIAFVSIGAVAKTSHDKVEDHKAYLQQVKELDCPDDLIKPAKPTEWDNKLYNIYDRFEEYSLNLRLLFNIKNAAEEKEASENKLTQADSAIEAMMLGGLFGTEYSSISEIQEVSNDMAFAYLALKLGVLNAILLIVLFVVMFIISVRECLNNSSHTTASLGIGFAAMFSLQAITSSMSALGFLPIIGIQIPFIGSGGAYLLVSFVVTIFIIYATSNKSIATGESKELIEI